MYKLKQFKNSLFLLFSSCLLSLNAYAESGTNCKQPPTDIVQRSIIWWGSMTNNLKVPVKIAVPRNEWICNDWYANKTPGKLDGLILQPGQTEHFSLWIDLPIFSPAAYRPFTYVATICNAKGSECNFLRERVSVNRFTGIDDAAYFYLYNPGEYVYVNDNSPKYRYNNIFIDGQKISVAYKSSRIYDSPTDWGEPAGSITFTYR